MKSPLCFAVALVITTPAVSSATIQIRDQIVLGDKTHGIGQWPMAGYWRQQHETPDARPLMPKFELQSTANWKGYEATWEIRDQKFYLKELTGKIDGKICRNDEILKKQFPLHATWFSGRIYVIRGKFDNETREHRDVLEFRIRRGDVVESVKHARLKSAGTTWNGMRHRGFPLRAKRILFLGDSITHAGHYISLIETRLRMTESEVPELINLGLPSETCSGLSEPEHPFPRPNVHERIGRALEKLKPDLVIACYGMNDGIYYPFDEKRFEAYREGINAIIDTVDAAGSDLILMTPPAFDALPLKKKGKLLPLGANKYSWNQIYEDYDSVMQQYSGWIMKQDLRVDGVIDLHTAVSKYVRSKRVNHPDFTMSPDGVHVNHEGHEVLADAILASWKVLPAKVDQGLLALISKRQKLMHDAWLSEVGHKRPGVKDGLPLDEAEEKSQDWGKQIEARSQLNRSIGEHPKVDPSKRDQSRALQPNDVSDYSHIHFPASNKSGELTLFADYYLWIPPDLKRVRGIIVHQHGCGLGASIGGLSAACDLHWQALAKKWDCALMGSSYEPRRGELCRLWCDPRRGSEQRFLQAIDHFSDTTGHPELRDVPWCLWGHSGGGFWASLMQTLHPERIVAIWLQSGTAYSAWQAGEIEKPYLRAPVYQVPVMACAGIKEKDHERFRRAWDGLTSMMEAYRKQDAPFGFIADPKTGHECGDSRYLAIPFFDVCLGQRLPKVGSKDQTLGPIDRGQSFYTSISGGAPAPKQVFDGNAVEAGWLPNAAFADLWEQFRQTGTVEDETPPNKPVVSCHYGPYMDIIVHWRAEADFESGIRGFRVLRNGETIATLPEESSSRFGRPLFQKMSYHDTPELPLPKRWISDFGGKDRDKNVYEVIAINGVGLESQPAKTSIRGVE